MIYELDSREDIEDFKHLLNAMWDENCETGMYKPKVSCPG